jgi:predicted dehydrogenase
MGSVVSNARRGNGVESDPMTAPLRVGVLGLGYWGPNLVRNLAELPGAELAWICDSRPDRLALVGARYPAAQRASRPEEVLADDSVDAVVIATPVTTHHPLAQAALEAGKHVFVEKPLAASTEEATDLIELADELELTLMPGHTFLYSPPVNLIRKLIDSGMLGELYFISTSRVNLGLHQRDVSVVWDLAPHDFSILRYWLAPSKLRRTTIVGSEKMVVYDDTSSEAVRVFDSGVELPEPETFGEYNLSYRTGDIVSPHLPPAEPLYLELEDFCAAIRLSTTPVSSSELGLEVVRMIEAVDASLAHSGARVRVEDRLPETLPPAVPLAVPSRVSADVSAALLRRSADG